MATARLNHPTKESAPVYTFGKKGFNPKPVTEVPGPGNYPIQEPPKPSTNAGTFGHGQRTQLHGSPDYSYSYEDEERPYDDPHLNFQKDGPKYSFEGKYEIKVRHEAPGPGNYDPRNILHEINRKSSFGVKIPKTTEKSEIGPGKYTPEKQKVTRNYSFGKGRRVASERRNLTPGPGNYNTNRNITTTQRTGFSFGTASRSVTQSKRYAGPGPGDYKQRESLNKRGAALLARRPDNTAYFGKDTPGPGTYTLPHSNTSASFSVGQSKRSNLARNKNQSPGPGEHDVEGTMGRRAVSMGRGMRPALTGNSKNPGPAEYNTEGRVGAGPKFSMGVKNYRNKIDDFPSAAEYDPDKSATVMQAAPNYAIGTGKRGGVRQPEKPGPGAYEPSNQTFTLPKYSFGNAPKKTEPTSLDPGPIYQIPASYPNAPKYLIPEKYEETIKLLN